MQVALLGPRVAHKTWPLVVVLVVLCGARPAWAALGEKAASPVASQTRSLAPTRILQTATHTVHEIEAPTGTLVREYLSPGGTVFAVSWQGPFRPNLRELLGSYYEAYLRAAAARPRVVRGPLNLQLPGLVIHMSGRQFACYGRVYLTDVLPQGLSPDEIR